MFKVISYFTFVSGEISTDLREGPEMKVGETTSVGLDTAYTGYDRNASIKATNFINRLTGEKGDKSVLAAVAQYINGAPGHVANWLDDNQDRALVIDTELFESPIQERSLDEGVLIISETEDTVGLDETRYLIITRDMLKKWQASWRVVIPSTTR